MGSCLKNTFKRDGSNMIHALLAGTFVTLALVFLALESFLRGQGTSKGFVVFYGLGMLGWTAVGILIDSSALVTISLIQFFATAMVGYFCFFKDCRNGVCS